MIFGCLVWSSISDGREIGYSNVLPWLPIPSSWTKLPVHALSTSWTHWQTNLNDLGYFLIFWCFYQITGLFTSSPILTSCPKPTSSQLISAHLFYDKTSSSKYFFFQKQILATCLVEAKPPMPAWSAQAPCNSVSTRVVHWSWFCVWQMDSFAGNLCTWTSTPMPVCLPHATLMHKCAIFGPTWQCNCKD